MSTSSSVYTENFSLEHEVTCSHFAAQLAAKTEGRCLEVSRELVRGKDHDALFSLSCIFPTESDNGVVVQIALSGYLDASSMNINGNLYRMAVPFTKGDQRQTDKPMRIKTGAMKPQEFKGLLSDETILELQKWAELNAGAKRASFDLEIPEGVDLYFTLSFRKGKENPYAVDPLHILKMDIIGGLLQEVEKPYGTKVGGVEDSRLAAKRAALAASTLPTPADDDVM